MKNKKLVYFFGGGKAEGKASMKNLLGGKGANLAEMAGHRDLKLPVPPGFTLSTEVCTYYWAHKRTLPKSLKEEVLRNLAKIESLTGKKFGDPEKPLLLSVRSGARKSMPGMMETILNCGLTEETIPGFIKLTNDPRFVYDTYRRLIMMYSDVVMEKATGIEPDWNIGGIRRQLERIQHEMKQKKGAKSDTELAAEDLKELCCMFKAKVKEVFKKEFPDNQLEQFWGSINGVLASWRGKRAVSYRQINGLPNDWGTAVNIQSMVFGNMGGDSSTGVAFTRNPGTGENAFFGEFLPNAQGEDVVSGIRTPQPINEVSRCEQTKDLMSMAQQLPAAYKELLVIRAKLEKHFHDMLDIEFTIEKGKLYMLECRVSKRSGPGALRIALEMYKEKLVTREQAVMMVTPAQLDELSQPVFDPKAQMEARPIARGLPAVHSDAAGMIVFSAAEAVKWYKEGKPVILVREETNPEDLEGMQAAQGILTTCGGMTSIAAMTARTLGKCCVVGCQVVRIDIKTKTLFIGNQVLKEGDWLSLDGNRGFVYKGKLEMFAGANDAVTQFLALCNPVRKLKVWANAETPADAALARKFGAEGIGLFRLEHLFYGKGSGEPLFRLRKVIMARTIVERKAALAELLPDLKNDLKAVFKVMEGRHVTVRLIDPPLHEFMPRNREKLGELAARLNRPYEEIEARAIALHESNPMIGHRGVRLGVTYPELTEMQARAIFEAAAELRKEGVKVFPELMLPVVSLENEVKHQAGIISSVYAEVSKQKGVRFKYTVGAMLEVPRACLLAGKLAETAGFFSFGSNDLTQLTYGYSRDDAAPFLKHYLENEIFTKDPFQTIDKEGVGELVKLAVQRGRKVNKELKIGMCGEQGGDPASIEFCHQAGLDYVSCSPLRVPIAILSAAQAQVNAPRK